jgi:extradiol dioxygenase family protein
MAFLRLSIAALSTFSTFSRGASKIIFEQKRFSGIALNHFGTARSVHTSKDTNIPPNSVFSRMLHIRGGESDEQASRKFSSESGEYPDPAPGSPFHLALPVHDLDIAKDFYGNVLGCAEGRSSAKWQDYSLNGHQIVCHWVGENYRCQDYFNPVDGDDVPVPHFGLALTEDQFHALADRLKNAGIQFIIEPHLRFKGQPGEQWTMFFKDPSGNNLEFKAMTQIGNLFAKYNVVEG